MRVFLCVPVPPAAAVYDTDSKGPRMTMTAAVGKSPIQYRASFASKAPRFASSAAPTDLMYSVDAGECVCVCVPALTRIVLFFLLPLPFRVAICVYARIVSCSFDTHPSPRNVCITVLCPPRPRAGGKTALSTAVSKSGQRYSAMRSGVARFRPSGAPDTAHLGPGYINTQPTGEKYARARV